MNKFYFDDKTEKIVRLQPNGSHTEILTSKDFDTFVEDYEKCIADGESIIDSIEWAR